MNDSQWEPIVRDLDAAERNIIRDSLAEIVQAHQLDLNMAISYITDAVNEYREKIKYELVPKSENFRVMRNCQNRCGRRVYVDGQHPVCQYCRDKASRKPCPDCGVKISPDSTRCNHCAIRHNNKSKKSNRKKLYLGTKKPDD